MMYVNSRQASAADLIRDKYDFVTSTEWLVLDEVCRQVTLKKGESFLVQDKMPKHCAFVQSGILKYSYMSDDMKENILDFAFDSGYVSDCAGYQNKQPGGFSVIALTNVSLLLIDNMKLEEICGHHPGLMRLCLKLSQQIMFRQAKHEQLISLKTPLDKYKMILKLFPGMLKNLKINDIAKYMNISREALSRARNTLRQSQQLI